jgi:hypothetical protein
MLLIHGAACMHVCMHAVPCMGAMDGQTASMDGQTGDRAHALERVRVHERRGHTPCSRAPLEGGVKSGVCLCVRERDQKLDDERRERALCMSACASRVYMRGCHGLTYACTLDSDAHMRCHGRAACIHACMYTLLVHGAACMHACMHAVPCMGAMDG